MSSNSSQFNTRRRQRYEENGSSIRREVVSSWQTRKSEAEGRKLVSEKVGRVAEYSRIRRLIYLPGYTRVARMCARVLHIPYLGNPFIDAFLANGIELDQSNTWESSERNNVSNLIIFSFNILGNICLPIPDFSPELD